MPDLRWMIGRSITEVEKKDYTWFFRFDDGTVIGTEDSWRLIVNAKIAITSEDHGHQFGHDTPVDAAGVVIAETNGKTVNRTVVDNTTGDLTLFLKSTFLTFLCLSSGYEAWRITHGDLEFICMGGGKVVKISNGKTSEPGAPANRR
jgi:hypothetical protein